MLRRKCVLIGSHGTGNLISECPIEYIVTKFLTNENKLEVESKNTKISDENSFKF